MAGLESSNSALSTCMDVLQCPITKKRLTLLTSSEIASINEDLGAGRRLHRDGSVVPRRLTLAIGIPTRDFVYRIEEDIVWLLPNLSIVSPEIVTIESFAEEKQIVQSFYDDFGWKKTSDGVYNDTAVFTDTRSIAKEYQRVCNARIKKLLGRGRLLLDAASGAIPVPEYLSFSENYDTRVCVDFSIAALTEAREKLGKRGLYVLGDITRLPLADGSIDSVISLHTIYHIPEREQATAIDELVRVTRPGGRVVVVYAWSRSLAMNATFKIRRWWLGFRQRFGRLSRPAAVTAATGVGTPGIYWHPHDHNWFAQNVAMRHGGRLRVWSIASMDFQSHFLPENLFGRWIIGAINALETSMPTFAGRIGQYPMFVIDKK
jgi:ubiquinone/menaquinone biosynthesis C-methylase UbiE/uncharacterized protein YbaR (Trm112 family)